MKIPIMLFILANGDVKNEVVVEPTSQDISEEPDMCVGCDDEEKEEVAPQQISVEIVIDPLTGNVQYIIKGLTIDQ